MIANWWLGIERYAVPLPVHGVVEDASHHQQVAVIAADEEVSWTSHTFAGRMHRPLRAEVYGTR